MKNVLYIGSGKSAIMALDDKYNDWTKVCVNNAWRLFEDSNFYMWIHSGDFPRENFPRDRKCEVEVGYHGYSKTCEEAKEYFKWDVTSPQHHAGYTIFFQGLYHIMMEIRPNRIGLLGFDHDYNLDKVEKWIGDNKPNIQNKFNNKTEETIKEWSDNYFKDFDEDFFYGHGTPDPMRLGEDYIIDKLKKCKINCDIMGIDLINLSNVSNNVTKILGDYYV